MAATVKLPGVYFSVEPRRAPDVLPRMDIAAFAGFAASGPLHLPVAIEDVGRFRDLFGSEVPLAWDEARGATETSWLGQTVEAFFRQGGRRCWVVRVADEDAAVTLDLQVPGIWPAGSSPLAGSSNSGAAAKARSPGWWATELNVGTRLRRERLNTLSAGGVVWDGSTWTVEVGLSPLKLSAGDLLELIVADGSLLFFLFVESAETVISASDPRIGFERVFGRQGFWYRAVPESPAPDIPLGADHPSLEPLPGADLADVQAQAQAASPGIVAGSAHRLTFDLLSWRGASIEHRLDGLGFASGHARFWADLPADSSLFEIPRGRQHRTLSPEEQAFETEAASPRFPIAGPPNPEALYLPLGMSILEDSSAAWTPEVPSISRLVFDGLQSFSDALFLDPRLVASLTGGLLAEAENRHYEEAVSLGTPPLRGVHSLLPVHEISMMSAPDACHRGWTQAPPETLPQLSAPDLHPIPAVDPLGRIEVTFTGPVEADSYRLQIARTTCFGSPDVTEVIQAEQPAPVSYRYYFVPADDCPVVFRFRVRSERLGEVSAWSRTRSAVIPSRHFEKCGGFPPGSAALILRAIPTSPSPGSLLVWDYEDSDDDLPDDEFQLQVAFEPGFTTPVKIAAGDPDLDTALRRYEVPLRADKTRYYRIRTTRNGFKGDWSNAVVVEPSNRTDWTVLPEGEFDDGALLAIQRGLLRFCAARADSVALLTLPRHYRELEVREHIGLLLPRVKSDREPALSTGILQVPALTIGEEQDGATSYAACFHPWPAGALPLEEGKRGDRLRIVYSPPDGLAAGSIAAKTLQSGAWISPANQPLAGVAALDPKLDLEQWGRLTEMQLNLAVGQPRGFLFLNSETLSPVEELRELNVRRLMILLRRLALREGETFVFEPNSDDFRSLVRQRFESWMSDLYVRGAFQGRTPGAAFRVVVDATVNPPLAVQRGRFLVELRVAPSRPFHFLNVRLLQTAPERLTVSEV